MAAQLAKERKARGLTLNYPETVAYLTAAILEGIRDGRSVSDLMSFGATSVASSSSVAQTLWGFTGTLQYKPVPSLTTGLEYRYDKSNQNVFQVGGRATSYQPTLSFEAIYAF